MSKYTITMGKLKEDGFDFKLDAYPIFDTNYRQLLNDKIIRHFYFREIGLETPWLFREFLQRKLNEIMPYYNQLYLSTQIPFDPLATKNIRELYERTQTAKLFNTTNSSGTNEAKNIFSDTPQKGLVLGDILNNLYATNANVDQTNGNAESSAQSDNTANEEYSKTVSGFEGIASELLLKYRQTFVNIDMDIINELNELFMNLY